MMEVRRRLHDARYDGTGGHLDPVTSALRRCALIPRTCEEPQNSVVACTTVVHRHPPSASELDATVTTRRGKIGAESVKKGPVIRFESPLGHHRHSIDGAGHSPGPRAFRYASTGVARIGHGLSRREGLGCVASSRDRGVGPGLLRETCCGSPPSSWASTSRRPATSRSGSPCGMASARNSRSP